LEISSIRKLGGLSLMAGGILLAVYAVSFNLLLPTNMMESDFSRLVVSPAWIPVSAMALVAILFLVFGFFVAYSVMAESSGVLAFAGFVTLIAAYLFQFGQLVAEVFYFPGIASTEAGLAVFRSDSMINHPAMKAFTLIFIVLIGLGILVFGISLARSRLFPTIGGILLIVGAVLYAAVPVFIVNLVGVAVFAAACFIVGMATRRAV